MPPKLKRLSGNEVISILLKFGFVIHSQRGSHIKLRRIISEGEKQTLIVPNHKEIDPGTLRAIIKQSSKYINENFLHSEFFSE
ncbi:MAG: type II toxin-antitoxin system HicA family toxin [Bacteroidota bacterium]